MRNVFPVILVMLFFILVGIERQALASLLPLANSNQWFYEFIDRSPKELPVDPTVTELRLGLGELENLGDFCMQPLTFGGGQLSLFLSNQDERLILYGFRGRINEREIEFFFHSGDNPTVFSGVPLAGMAQNILLAEQQGRQTRVINEQKVNIEWQVRNKVITSELLTESYTGVVASVLHPIHIGELYTIEFYLYLGPCGIEGGCNAGIFTFTFLEGLGLTEVYLRGDHPQFGGQFDHIFSLLIEPNNAFALESQQNRVGYTSCPTKNTDDLHRSQLGNIANWFNIFLLVVVVLRGFRASIQAYIRLPKSKVNR